MTSLNLYYSLKFVFYENNYSLTISFNITAWDACNELFEEINHLLWN